ncbi:V-type ATP synthase subunit E [Youxingia wuxianensis]|uniref:Uncharacterized protein n=1 Tax=Youxingia wuxianensis TaxID=2763678 RepID=A0A926ERU1_9FIRM|nr:V-type proton ATPase subunit E [Youxingia wuxianensis]MBC8586292.1 hypothetical protein [Youxingia wuxianensis]
MAQASDDKVFQFEEAIMAKAARQQQEILDEVKKIKHQELEAEENKLLGELYTKIQQQMKDMKTQNTKKISQETTALRKQMYLQREQYLKEIFANARMKLIEFSKSAEYETYLVNKVSKLAEAYPFPKNQLRINTKDLPLKNALEKACPGADIVTDDENILIGGVILFNAVHSVEEDCSLDAALRQQKDWFYKNSGFHF